MDTTPDTNPFGELASAAIAIAFALRARGRPDDQAAAHLLDQLGSRALMHLATDEPAQAALLAGIDAEDGPQ